MKRNRAISEFIKEAGLVIRGLIDAGYTEQFHRYAPSEPHGEEEEGFF